MIVKDHFNSWEKLFNSQKWGSYPPEDLIRFVARNFYQVIDRGAVKILEIGCGPAANLCFLTREHFSVYGIDFSETAISLARKKLDNEYPEWKGELKVGDIAALPFKNDFFDAVIDIEAVSCNSFEKSKLIYSEAARVLKPGGLLYSKMFANGSWGDGTGEPLGYNTWLAEHGPLANKGPIRFTQKTDLETLFSPFKIVEMEIVSRTPFQPRSATVVIN